MVVIDSRLLGASLHAQTGFEFAIAFAFVYPSEADNATVPGFAAVDVRPRAVFGVVVDLSDLGGGPTLAILRHGLASVDWGGVRGGTGFEGASHTRTHG